MAGCAAFEVLTSTLLSSLYYYCPVPPTTYISHCAAAFAAAVFDSCGMAGGSPHRGGFGAQYFNTSHASQGQKGSEVLLPLQSLLITMHD